MSGAVHVLPREPEVSPGFLVSDAVRVAVLAAANEVRATHRAHPLIPCDRLTERAQHRAEAAVEDGDRFKSSKGFNVWCRREGDVATLNPTGVALQAVRTWMASRASYRSAGTGLDDPDSPAAEFVRLVWRATRHCGVGFATKGKYLAVVMAFTPRDTAPDAVARLAVHIPEDEKDFDSDAAKEVMDSWEEAELRATRPRTPEGPLESVRREEALLRHEASRILRGEDLGNPKYSPKRADGGTRSQSPTRKQPPTPPDHLDRFLAECLAAAHEGHPLPKHPPPPPPPTAMGSNATLATSTAFLRHMAQGVPLPETQADARLRVAELEEWLGVAEEELAGARERCQALEDVVRLCAGDEKVRALSAACVDKDRQIEDLRFSLENMSKQLEETQKAVATLEKDKMHLTGKVNALENAVAYRNRRIADMTQEGVGVERVPRPSTSPWRQDPLSSPSPSRPPAVHAEADESVQQPAFQVDTFEEAKAVAKQIVQQIMDGGPSASPRHSLPGSTVLTDPPPSYTTSPPYSPTLPSPLPRPESPLADVPALPSLPDPQEEYEMRVAMALLENMAHPSHFNATRHSSSRRRRSKPSSKHRRQPKTDSRPVITAKELDMMIDPLL